jgi:hypothetical protein
VLNYAFVFFNSNDFFVIFFLIVRIYELLQAMEMMKVKGGSSRYTKNTFYQSYFDAFIENKSYYPLKVKDEVAQESEMNQVFLYILFLISPIFVVLLLAVQKRT